MSSTGTCCLKDVDASDEKRKKIGFGHDKELPLARGPEVKRRPKINYSIQQLNRIAREIARLYDATNPAKGSVSISPWT